MAEFDISSPADRVAVLRSIQPETAILHQAVLRQIFAAEMEYRRQAIAHQYCENLYWCAYLLFWVADPRDTESMWLAKHLNMDTGCGFDTENMVGAGVLQTIAYLRQNDLNPIADHIADRFPGDSRQEIADWSHRRQQYFYGPNS